MERRTPTILVVDDDKAGELYREVLTSRGYEVVTGRVEQRWQRAAIDAGCDAFLHKPCPLGELVHQVRRLLEDRTDEPTVRLAALTPPGARSVDRS
jgi:DNA-binding response OmpR family regulator